MVRLKRVFGVCLRFSRIINPDKPKYSLVNKIKNNKHSNSCEMDTKIKIKEEDPLADDTVSQSQREIFPNYLTINVNSENILLDDHCNTVTKTEVKSETPFIDCSLKQFKSEAITVSNTSELVQQTLVLDFGSQNERDFLPDDPLMNVKKYNSDHEVDNKIEFREEQCWLETGTSYVLDDSKVGDFSPVNSSRLCMEGDSCDRHVKSPLPSAEVPERVKSFLNEKDQPQYESQESDITEIPTAEEYVHSQRSVECKDGDINNSSLYSESKNFSHNGKKSLKCSICGNNFKYKSELKRHGFVHGGERPYMCKTCDKSFTRLSHLRAHNLIHEGKRPHQCKICNKSFTHLSHLKRHTLIHEGKKPHHCKKCNKSFTRSSHLKSHNSVHEGKKPHHCKTCNKSFRELSKLKTHNLIHEGKKPHECKICDKSFTQSGHLKVHNLIHEGKKPHQCKICYKCFSQASNLKRHNLIHQAHYII